MLYLWSVLENLSSATNKGSPYTSPVTVPRPVPFNRAMCPHTYRQRAELPTRRQIWRSSSSSSCQGLALVDTESCTKRHLYLKRDSITRRDKDFVLPSDYLCRILLFPSSCKVVGKMAHGALSSVSLEVASIGKCNQIVHHRVNKNAIVDKTSRHVPTQFIEKVSILVTL
jgi:hypothetical protein